MKEGRYESPTEKAVRIGDHLQSEASRLAAWIRSHCDETGEVPYEVVGAVMEVEGAVDEWTDLRRIWHPVRCPDSGSMV